MHESLHIFDEYLFIERISPRDLLLSHIWISGSDFHVPVCPTVD